MTRVCAPCEELLLRPAPPTAEQGHRESRRDDTLGERDHGQRRVSAELDDRGADQGAHDETGLVAECHQSEDGSAVPWRQIGGERQERGSARGIREAEQRAERDRRREADTARQEGEPDDAAETGEMGRRNRRRGR